MERYNELTDKYKDVLVEETKDYIREKVQEIVNEYLGGTGVKNNYSEDEQYILDGIADGINEICDYIEEGIADGTLTGCEHICHSNNWFFSFIWGVVNFFCRLFKINPVCECGMAHY